MTGDERWASDGELYREYDLELEDADDSGSRSGSVVEVDLGINNDPDKIIDFSKMHQALGVNAFSENNAFENKNVGDNGGESVTHSDYSAEQFADELTGILSFN